MTITMREARAKARALGLRIKSTGWDDYRVYWPEDANDTERGYFTPDLQDAIDTAHAMAAERHRKNLKETNRFISEAQQRNADTVRALNHHIDALETNNHQSAAHQPQHQSNRSANADGS